jgi:hypothetical protein
MTPEHKLKISMAMKGKAKSDEHRKNMSVAKVGIAKSESHRINIGISHRGIKKTLAAKDKQANSIRDVAEEKYEIMKIHDCTWKEAGILRKEQKLAIKLIKEQKNDNKQK